MMNMGFFSKAGITVIVAPTKTISNVETSAACKTHVKVDNDGDLYASDNGGAFGSSYETWLDIGLSSEAWVERTVISGSLNDGDPGNGRKACSTDRTYGIIQSAEGIKTTVIDLKWYDASSGGNLLDTQRVTLIAENEAE